MTGPAIFFTILCPLFGAAYLLSCAKKRYGPAFWLKGLAGLCFIGVCLSLAIEQAGLPYPRLIFFGLVFGLIGDQLLALRFLHPARGMAFFVSGAVAFAVGHVLYLSAMHRLDEGAWLFALVPFALGLALAAVYVLRRDLDAGRLFVPGCVYIALVIAVAAMGTALFLRGQGARALLLMLGGVSFAVSDCVLCVQAFGREKTTRRNVVLHVTYYAAQLLLAWSVAV